MFFEVVTLAACTGAAYQAYRGTTSLAARIGMYSLILFTVMLVLF